MEMMPPDPSVLVGPNLLQHSVVSGGGGATCIPVSWERRGSKEEPLKKACMEKPAFLMLSKVA